MAYEEILTEARGRVGIITLNRPERRNALTSTMRREMRQQIQAWNQDDTIGAIVLTGAGQGFCSGADIGSFEQTLREGPRTRGAGADETDWIELARHSKPIVCAVNGVAVGEGVTLTLPCDIRVAADQAQFSFRFVRIGLTPELGSTHYLVHLVGLGLALELMLTGRFVTGEEALRIGLVNHVYPADRLMDEAVALAHEVADSPGWQLLATKQLVHDHYLERDLAKVVEREREVFRQAQATDAHREALAAFRERRPPRFR